VDFLAERFTVFGVEFQYWMPIFFGAVALYVLFLHLRGSQWF